MKNKLKKFIIVIIIILFICSYRMYLYNQKHEKIKNQQIEKEKEIKAHYSNFVKTNKVTKLYNCENNALVGELGTGVETTLKKIKINYKTKYFVINEFEQEYCINYADVDPIETLSEKDNRYKTYIPFNKNVITGEKTNFYNNENNLVYSFNKSFDLPIIINDSEIYGVEFNDNLLYIKKENVKEIKDNLNTDLNNTSGIGVLNYHAFYDENDPVARSDCNTSICHSKAQFKTHLDYLKENNILTLKMKEVEMYIDGKLQLPKSVLITIDDGGRVRDGIDMLTEYHMYATIFLVTAWFEPSEYYRTEYIELHSHSHNMHNQGDCPTGQGGAIQCFSEDKIKEDLKISREKLDNTKYFCYPFYEYNEYSIKMLKDSGFTMAFIGENQISDNLVHVQSDKFRLRRFVITTMTTMQDFANYFNQIK